MKMYQRISGNKAVASWLKIGRLICLNALGCYGFVIDSRYEADHGGYYCYTVFLEYGNYADIYIPYKNEYPMYTIVYSDMVQNHYDIKKQISEKTFTFPCPSRSPAIMYDYIGNIHIPTDRLLEEIRTISYDFEIGVSKEEMMD